MISRPPSISSWLLLTIASLLAFGPAPRAGATGGPFGTQDYLAEGGQRVGASPEFYWADELERLARDYQVKEKRVAAVPSIRGQEGPTDEQRAAPHEMTSKADLDDFAAAISAGRIKPPDAAKAKSQHEQARAQIDTADDKTNGPLSAEFDSEFADYHKGAYAYARGEDHWAEAKQAWEKLLQRPAEQRHDRSVWAAFMLGKMLMKQGDPAAVTWFEKTRALARKGFPDSLGMAADSYGWEGRSEWKQEHPEKAAPLFLAQLTLGDDSAIVSLKALIPDRAQVDGLLNYGPESEDVAKWTDEERKAADEKTKARLAAAARDPLLRRLVTVHILATGTYATFMPEEPSDSNRRAKNWLAAISSMKLKSLPDAEYLGWLAYNAGDFAGAERWLALTATPDSPASAWLRSKLLKRAGKLVEAAKSMELAWMGIQTPATYFGWVPSNPELAEYDRGFDELWSLRQSAGGDVASIRLARADFLQALDTFRRADLPGDAVYIAERVLTADELKKYVDQLPPVSPEAQSEGGYTGGKVDWRYLMGRRLVREDRYDEAAAYLPEAYRKLLAIYVKALQDGANEKLSAPERARAWFKAAWIARKEGMELMGTQEAPDGFATEGEFESIDIAADRTQGTYKSLDFGADGKPSPKIATVQPKPTKEELKRLAQNKIRPDVRFHYRVIAAALAMKAAALLPDQTEELADVINTAGNWVKDRDDKAADKDFEALRRRCGQTALGKKLLAKKWFSDDETGPWSDREASEHDALMKEINPEKPAQ